jgi:hypothetical protein
VIEQESPFTVGQRAYWIHEEYSYFSVRPIRYVLSGVVMSTGPALTQVWNDIDPDSRKHHALTYANDRLWPDHETPARMNREKTLKEREVPREAGDTP